MWCFSELFSTQENFGRKRLCDSQIRRNKLWSQVLRITLKIVRKIEETSPQVHMQYEMRVHTTLDIISILTRKYVDKMTP